jgi:hypothetical protein
MADINQEAAVGLFCSYAHEDEPLQRAFLSHSAILRRNKWVDIWTDQRIGAGSKWDREIASKLETAQLVVLLVSSDFIESEYCYGTEMTRAMARQDAGQTKVIPIIVRPCLWQDAPFAALSALPPDGKPVTSWANQDEAWTAVTIGVKLAVKEVLEDTRKRQQAILAAGGGAACSISEARERLKVLMATAEKVQAIETNLSGRLRSADTAFQNMDDYIRSFGTDDESSR